jgi:hypothetical protein
LPREQTQFVGHKSQKKRTKEYRAMTRTDTTTKTTHHYLRALVLLVGLAVVISSLVEQARPARAAFPGENGKIIYASDRTTGAGVNNPDGDYEIFAMNKDGSGVRPRHKVCDTCVYLAWQKE